MHLSVVMVTLGRPRLVEQAIRMFELQSHQDADMLVIDTANQMRLTRGNRWLVLPQPQQDWSLAETVNRGIESAVEGSGIARWDDDDWYFPWHLAAVSDALERGDWACPSVVWDEESPGRYIQTRTAARPDGSDCCYAGAWAFRKAAWRAVGGYPTHAMSEKEVDFRTELFRRFGSPQDTISERYPVPSYCYFRHRADVLHDSCSTDEERMARRRGPFAPWPAVWPRWPDNYMLGLPPGEAVQDRKW